MSKTQTGSIVLLKFPSVVRIHKMATLEMDMIETILGQIENAKIQKDTNGNPVFENPKPNVKNQARFSKIFTMFHEKTTFGKIKLTVGELRGSRHRVQYCITAIENG